MSIIALVSRFNSLKPLTNTSIKQFKVDSYVTLVGKAVYELNEKSQWVIYNHSDREVSENDSSNTYTATVTIGDSNHIITFASRESFEQYLLSQIEILS